MAAKEKWISGDIGGAKDILTRAFEKNPESESIWLAAAKLAAETGQMEAALQVLDKARKEADTDKVRVPVELPEEQQLTFALVAFRSG